MRFLSCVLMLVAALFTVAGTGVSISPIGSYATGVFDDGAAEIGAFDPASQRLFVVNGATGNIDVLDLSDPTAPGMSFTIDLSSYGDQANSVAIHNGIVAAAVQADNKQDPGVAVFFDTNGTFLNQVTVGALPDMLTFSPNGMYVLVANEGEPNDDITVDPEGSISIINLSAGVGSPTVNHATFTAFNGTTLADSIRIFTPGSTVAQDLEPEYIVVSSDSSTAWAVCQENNALAIIDIATATVTNLLGLGFKDHNLAGNGIDASNRDDAINIANWPVYGMYQPDAIARFDVAGVPYIISANEGDSRDYDGFSEEDRVGDLTLDPVAFPDAATLQLDENLGRLKITTTLGDDGNDGDYERLYAYGARSFSIWNGNTGALIYDSGDDLESAIAAADPTNFNSTNDDNDSFDNRSDDKGPEPEGVTIGHIGGTPHAFIGVERMGGIFVYDVSNPDAPVFLQYINNRNFAAAADTPEALDLAPEGLTFIPASDSPNLRPLLVTFNEVSGTTTVFEVAMECDEPQIIEVAPVGESGITISGSHDCLYEVTIVDANGNEQVIPILVGEDGTGFTDEIVPADSEIIVSLNGVAAGAVATVPTLGEWALIILMSLLAFAGITINRKQQ